MFFSNNHQKVGRLLSENAHQQERIRELEARQEKLHIQLLRYTHLSIKLEEAIRERETELRNLRLQLRKQQVDAKVGYGEIYRNPFSQDELETMLRLCHPDKHGGKESATRITQKILSLRGK